MSSRAEQSGQSGEERSAGQAKPGLSAQQRSRRARIAAHVCWAKTVDRKARTSAGTKAFCDRFERQVDPEGVLPQPLRRELARHARKAYMLQLAEKSARARRRA